MLVLYQGDNNLVFLFSFSNFPKIFLGERSKLLASDGKDCEKVNLKIAEKQPWCIILNMNPIVLQKNIK